MKYVKLPETTPLTTSWATKVTNAVMKPNMPETGQIIASNLKKAHFEPKIGDKEIKEPIYASTNNPILCKKVPFMLIPQLFNILIHYFTLEYSLNKEKKRGNQ